MSTPSYQINYGPIATVPAAPRIDPAAPLYASEDGVVASLSNNECVFQVRRSGEPHVMTFQVLQALDQSREFRTLDEHRARIMATVPGLSGASEEAVSRVLQSLVERGLLVSDGDFLDRLQAGSARAAPAPLRAAFIRACDRPAQLGALLDSLTEYERGHQAGRRYVVLDDSRSAGAAEQNRDRVREFARTTGCAVSHIGAAERERIVRHLEKAVPAAEGAVRHLLAGQGPDGEFGGGRGWNLALLLSAGARLALFDEDFRLPLRRSSQAQPGLALSTAQRSVEFHRNLENALAAGEAVDGDPFELHMSVAGHTLAEVIANEQYAVGREALRGLALSRLDHLSADARLLASHHGVYGSAGTESSLWLYSLPPEGRKAFAATRDAYLRNLDAGAVWHGHERARVSSAGTFTPFLLDNSVLLPCTNPFGRGEDALFSRVMSLMHPHSLVMELPLAIGHVQEGTRRRSAQAMQAYTPRFNYLVRDLIGQLPQLNAEAPGQRLAVLAAHLRDLGAGSPAALARYLEEWLTYVRSNLIERLQNQLQDDDAPVWWQADVRAIVETNGRALLERGVPRLGGWPEEFTAADAGQRLAQEANLLASAYETWPALWAYARDNPERLLGSL